MREKPWLKAQGESRALARLTEPDGVGNNVDKLSRYTGYPDRNDEGNWERITNAYF
jgi:hypothetical protein